MAAKLRIGDLEIESFTDGCLQSSLDNLIGMTRAEGEALVGTTQDGLLFIPVNNFLIRRGGNLILIDAGAGRTMQPTLGRLPDNLRAAGIDPASITHVLLTHIHSDHANGLIDEDGRPNFPNAQLVVPEKELAFWLGAPRGREPDNVRRNRLRASSNLAPYREHLRAARDGDEVCNLVATPAPGHTPGHTCWRIECTGAALLAWGDLVHFSAIQIARPDIAVTHDLDKDLARQTRRRILDMVATDRIAIAGAHVAGSGFGYVVRNGASYALEPPS